MIQYCSDKCSKKDLSLEGIVDRKCKVCKKPFKGRFTAICPTCQFKKTHCIKCGKPLEKEDSKNESA